MQQLSSTCPPSLQDTFRLHLRCLCYNKTARCPLPRLDLPRACQSKTQQANLLSLQHLYKAEWHAGGSQLAGARDVAVHNQAALPAPGACRGSPGPPAA